MEFQAFLIKYAEIGVKGKNRYLFEDALVQQIKYALKKCEGEFAIRKTQGRIYVDALTEFDYDETNNNELGILIVKLIKSLPNVLQETINMFFLQ